MVSHRDRQAGIKLLGGILRLREFTATQLHEFTGVNIETTRAFLKPDKGPGLVEPVGTAEGSIEPDEDAASAPETASAVQGAIPAGEGGRIGRPAKVYRLAPGKKAIALKTLADYRQSLELAEPPAITASGAEEDLTPIALLEAAITPLEAGGIGRDEWQDRIQQARIYLDGARADVHAMTRPGIAATVLQQSSERFGIAQGRLAAIERMGPPQERERTQEARKPLRRKFALRAGLAFSDVAASRILSRPAGYRFVKSNVDLLKPVVHRYGRWACTADVEMFDPVVILLDGVRGHDRMSSWVVDACSAHGVPVAAIDLADAGPADRARVYGTIDRLRATTPLALASVVMTMDSSTGAARDYAAEIKDLVVLGAWEAKSDSDELEELQGLGTADDETLREFFVTKSAQYATLRGKRGTPVDAHRRAFASRVVTALSGVSAAHAAEAAATSHMHFVPLPGDEPENQPTELRAAASKLMGHVYCFDFAEDATIGRDLSDAGVTYVPKAIDHMTRGLAWNYNVGVGGY